MSPHPRGCALGPAGASTSDRERPQQQRGLKQLPAENWATVGLPHPEGILPHRPTATPPVFQSRLCLSAVRGDWFNLLFLSFPSDPG